MSFARITGALLTLSIVATACSSSSPDAAEGPTSTTTSAETTTSATFRQEPVVDARLTPEFLAGSLEEQIADFLESPNSGKSAFLADAMGESGDVEWAPWLLDLHRLGQSTMTDDRVVAALESMSGIPAAGNRTDDFQNYGQWWQSQNRTPSEGYREWKLGLYGIIDDEFAELLAGVPDDLLLSQIHWGGVLRGGIPELNNPARLPVSEADWMEPDELVLGAEVNGEAVAYPVRILGHHEMANDVIAGVPVSMVYCTLCRTGLLFDRRFQPDSGEELVLDFETSGLLWSTNKIMIDQQSDTLWQHLSGVGIAGPNIGETLTQLPAVTTSWEDWVAEHPDSETLEIPEPIFFPETPDRPPIAYSYEAGGAYANYYENPDVWFPIFDTPEDFELKASVMGIAHEGESLAVGVEALEMAGPTAFVVGGRPVVLVPAVGGGRAYDGTGLELADGEPVELVDASPEAITLAGGDSLPRLIITQSFWFAWFGDHQDTRTWDG